MSERSIDRAVEKHLRQRITERVPLPGGYDFDTWLLTLSGGEKVVFRTRSDYTTGGGRRIVVADVFAREKFFYDSVHAAVVCVCPAVFVIDGSCEAYDRPFQIAEYIEGIPLNLCFDGFGPEKRERILYQMGEMAAKINSLEIDPRHPYVSDRSSWETFFAKRLWERLVPLVGKHLITPREIQRLVDAAAVKKARKSLSFLHLDMRMVNMIHNDGRLFLLDAENCEFGDPLFELAVMDMNGCLTDSFAAGYSGVLGEMPDLRDELYDYYRLERLALVLDLLLNEVDSGGEEVFRYTADFHMIKCRLLQIGKTPKVKIGFVSTP